MMKTKFKNFMFVAFWTLALIACEDDQPNIIVNWTYSPEENIQVGDTIYFTNNSTADVSVTYEWNFGDGEISTEESPKHVYSEPGIYDVLLELIYEDSSGGYSQQIEVAVDYSYIVNYGSYSGDKGTISAYNKYTDEMTNGFYKAINGVDLISNVQYAYQFNDKVYMLGNNADQLFWVDSRTFEQTENAINTDIVKPRYCAGKDDYLYVSCWGGDIWADESLSYIAKVNLSTNSVEKKIALPGGPEGLAIANDKLYAALNYKDSVAVISLNDETVAYIETPAVTSYFVKDDNNNLYVSLISTYSDFSASTGLGYINTSNDQIEAIYQLDGVSTSYVNILSPNADLSKLYVMTSAYDANWNLSGAIAVFDVASKSFDSNMLLEGVSGLNGIGYDDDKVYCFVAESVTGNGKAISYSTEGTKLNEYETGIAPFMLLTAK